MHGPTDIDNIHVQKTYIHTNTVNIQVWIMFGHKLMHTWIYIHTNTGDA